MQAIALKRVSLEWVGASRAIAALSLVVELVAAAIVVAYVAQRPGVRASLSVAIAIAAAFGLAAWTLGASEPVHGSLREVLQRALSLRLESAGPVPPWVAPTAVARDLGGLEAGDRLALLPLAIGEWLSMTLPIGCLAAARRDTLPTLAAMALAVSARAQVDVPLRALELGVAALAALAVARSADAQ
jgi:hypothetical protein